MPWLTEVAAQLPTSPRTRFAPAPTGALHLGHVVNAVLVWGLARALDGRVILRLEDHDGTRARPAFEQGILDDLDWLGLEPDEPLTRQSARSAVYEQAVERLDRAGLVYACDCSRRTLAVLLPDLPGEEVRYPGRCRHRELPRTSGRGWRVQLPDEPIDFRDLSLGPQRQHPAAQCGDLLIRDRLGHWTYQFAVTADDQQQRIDLVIRGRDLLASTGRQIALSRLLGRDEPPAFLHHALLLHPDGSKLAKSRGSTAIAELRAAGASPGEVLQRAATFAGLHPRSAMLRVESLPELVSSVNGLEQANIVAVPRA